MKVVIFPNYGREVFPLRIKEIIKARNIENIRYGEIVELLEDYLDENEVIDKQYIFTKKNKKGV